MFSAYHNWVKIKYIDSNGNISAIKACTAISLSYVMFLKIKKKKKPFKMKNFIIFPRQFSYGNNNRRILNLSLNFICHFQMRFEPKFIVTSAFSQRYRSLSQCTFLTQLSMRRSLLISAGKKNTLECVSEPKNNNNKIAQPLFTFGKLYIYI